MVANGQPRRKPWLAGDVRMDRLQDYEDDMEEEVEEAPQVTLHLGDREIVSVAWCDLHEEQDADWKPELGVESWTTMTQVDDVVAFFDRTHLDAPWRRAFVV